MGPGDDRSGEEAGGGGTGSRPETSCAEGSVSRPAVATGGKRRRGSGSAAASSGADEVLLVLVDAICFMWVCEPRATQR